MSSIWPFLSKDIVIEDATVDWCAALADVHRSSFPRGWTADEIVRLMQDDQVLCFMCRRPATLFRPASKEPKAFVLARNASDEAEILTIGVAPDARELGLGRALMQRVMDELYTLRVDNLFLEVDEGNDPAITLYRKLGFKQVGERKSYYKTQQSERTNDNSAPSARALVMKCEIR